MNYLVPVLFVFIGILSRPVSCFSQDLAEIQAEMMIQEVVIGTAPTNEEREAASVKLKSLIIKVIKRGEAYTFPFDELIKVSTLRSPDQFFRIFNWQVPYIDGKSRYECLIVFPESKKWLELSNKTKMYTQDETAVYTSDSWYGCLYYDIQCTQSKGQKYYTLLGWDNADELTTRKYLECFNFDGQKSLSLGIPIFELDKKLVNRRIFNYSEDVSMTLRYIKPKEAIIFDHLQPVNDRFIGQYAFYGPSDSFDGYRWNAKTASWDFIDQIDMTRPKGTEEKSHFNFPTRPDLDRTRDTINPLIGK